jgi:hypothetical protein
MRATLALAYLHVSKEKAFLFFFFLTLGMEPGPCAHWPIILSLSYIPSFPYFLDTGSLFPQLTINNIRPIQIHLRKNDGPWGLRIFLISDQFWISTVFILWGMWIFKDRDNIQQCCLQESAWSWVMVAHICNPRYLGSEDSSSKRVPGNSSRDPISKKPLTKKGWWSGSRCRPWVQTPVPKEKKKIK